VGREIVKKGRCVILFIRRLSKALTLILGNEFISARDRGSIFCKLNSRFVGSIPML
jgi:hypothetical protein